MTRPRRILVPHLLYHVYNRALARRTAFETTADFRAFTCLLVLAHRRYGIRVIAFSLVPTHFHLLIEAPDDPERMSDAMRFLEGQYTRYFNRARKRDGPLWRTRYFAKEVLDAVYRLVLIRYIDANPVEARIVARSAEYPYGSAQLYQRHDGPLWLAREHVERTVRHYTGSQHYDPADYNRILGSEQSGYARDLVHRSMRGNGSRAIAGLSNLVRAAPADVQAWMQSKARLADGTGAGTPVAAAAALHVAVARIAWPTGPAPGKRPGPMGTPSPTPATVAIAGLLRDAGGLSLREIGRRMCVSPCTVERYVERHRARMREQPAYALAAATAVCHAVRETLGAFADAPIERLLDGAGTVRARGGETKVTGTVGVRSSGGRKGSERCAGGRVRRK